MTDAVKMAPDGVVISRELLAFLCGDGPLDGHYFGEKPEHERGNFWWRKALRAAEKTALEQAGEPVAVTELDDRNEGMVCTGCGTTKTVAFIKANSPTAFTCCPERNMIPVRDAIKPAESPLPTLQRLGQEFDAGDGWADLMTKAIGDIAAALALAGKTEKVASWTAPYVAAVNQFDAHPPQSRGQAFDGEGWQPIETAPTDDSMFWVGTWEGELLIDENGENPTYEPIGWVRNPRWFIARSHHENPHGPHEDRGWNHRNGPFRGRATHWWKESMPKAPSHGLPVLGSEQADKTRHKLPQQKDCTCICHNDRIAVMHVVPCCREDESDGALSAALSSAKRGEGEG
jgi:hypothetical protein